VSAKDHGRRTAASSTTAVILDHLPSEISHFRKIAAVLGNVDLLGEARSLDEAINLAKSFGPDVVFADAKTLGPAGSNVLRTVAPAVRVVAVGDDSSLAADAFGQGVDDYLLRPLTAESLTVSLLRVQVLGRLAATGSRPQATRAGASEEPQTPGGILPRKSALKTVDMVTLSLERGRSVDVVPVLDIIWIKALQNYTQLQLASRKPVVLKRTLSEWESLLPAGHFVRISRSIIVQLARLRSSQWLSRNKSLLAFDGTDAQLQVGRPAATRLKNLLRHGEIG
jgi:two-component system LytT family response regulator